MAISTRLKQSRIDRQSHHAKNAARNLVNEKMLFADDSRSNISTRVFASDSMSDAYLRFSSGLSQLRHNSAASASLTSPDTLNQA